MGKDPKFMDSSKLCSSSRAGGPGTRKRAWLLSELIDGVIRFPANMANTYQLGLYSSF